MKLNDYQLAATKTAVYPQPAGTYLSIALVGECGELCNEYKKELRNNENRRDQIISEIGDVLWYLSAICTETNQDLEKVFIKAYEETKWFTREPNEVLNSLVHSAIRLWDNTIANGFSFNTYYYIYPSLRVLLYLMDIYNTDIDEVISYNLNKLAQRAAKDELKIHE